MFQTKNLKIYHKGKVLGNLENVRILTNAPFLVLELETKEKGKEIYTVESIDFSSQYLKLFLVDLELSLRAPESGQLVDLRDWSRKKKD